MKTARQNLEALAAFCQERSEAGGYGTRHFTLDFSVATRPEWELWIFLLEDETHSDAERLSTFTLLEYKSDGDDLETFLERVVAELSRVEVR